MNSILCLRYPNHPMGDLDISDKVLNSFKENFDGKARRVDLAIDYSHESWAQAAGWIKGIEIKNGSLWMDVDWTPSAKKKLEEKEFRYLSAEFALNWKDEESGKEFGPTLLGAGLTNRPFVKEMMPVTELSEYNRPRGGDPMGEKELTEKLSETVAKLADLEIKLKASEVLSDSLKKEISDMKHKEVVETKKRAFDEMMIQGKCCEAQRKAYMEGDMESFIKLSQALNITSTGVSGQGGAVDPKSSEDAQAKVLELAEKKMKDLKLPLARAISLVLQENPKLRAAYEAA